MAFLQNLQVPNLRQKFYELLTDFATFPAAQNFFLVNIKNKVALLFASNILGINKNSIYNDILR